MSGKVISAGRPILGAFLISLVIGWLDSAIGRRLGLESLELGAWVSLLLGGSTIAFLFALFRPVREACVFAVETLTSKKVLTWSGAIVAGGIALYALAWSSHLVRPVDVGWTHYFSLPAESRPGFLLHYLLVTGFVACVVGPVGEELLHVGVVIGSLRAGRVARPWIYAINAGLFVLLHQANSGTWIGGQAAFSYVCGRLFFDYLYYKTDNLAVPVLGHVVHNTGAMALRVLPLL